MGICAAHPIRLQEPKISLRKTGRKRSNARKFLQNIVFYNPEPTTIFDHYFF
jgi:hypothetical protein